MFRKKINFKGRKIALLAIAAVLMTIGCQKDDICPESTATTPLIKVLFFDAENTDQNDPKSAINLKVKAQIIENDLITRSTVSAINLPLNTNVGENTNVGATTYEFTEYARVSGDTEPNTENPPNTDVLRITYSIAEEYLNRACGYRVLYNNIQVEISEPEDDTSGNWITNITVQDSIIDNETTTYFFIYH